MNDVMIDLETMGTNTDAAIMAIGACFFDKMEIGSTLYVNVDLQSCFDNGLKADGNTIYWWLSKGSKQEARDNLMISPMHIIEALDWLNKFLYKGGEDYKIWSRGPDFDISILKTAYQKIGEPVPWKYNAARDVRTVTDRLDTLPDRSSIEHDALGDAIHQAKCVQAFWNAEP